MLSISTSMVDIQVSWCNYVLGILLPKASFTCMITVGDASFVLIVSWLKVTEDYMGNNAI